LGLVERIRCQAGNIEGDHFIEEGSFAGYRDLLSRGE
jgi:hypothetical protein